MLEILTKPVIIGNISIPFVMILLIVIVISAVSFLSILYFKEIERKKKIELEEKKLSSKSKKIKEDLSKEKEYKKKIQKLKRSVPYLNKKEASNKFIQIVRSFFKDLLKLKYEFTFEELSDELKERNRHKDLILFCKKISQLKYKKGDISKKELLKLSKQFEDLLDYEEIPQVEKIKRNSFFSKLGKSSVSHVRKPPVNNKENNSQNS